MYVWGMDGNVYTKMQVVEEREDIYMCKKWGRVTRHITKRAWYRECWIYGVIIFYGVHRAGRSQRYRGGGGGGGGGGGQRYPGRVVWQRRTGLCNYLINYSRYTGSIFPYPTPPTFHQTPAARSGINPNFKLTRRRRTCKPYVSTSSPFNMLLLCYSSLLPNNFSRYDVAKNAI